MKLAKLLSLFFALSLFLMNCGGSPSSDTAETGDAEEVDSSAAEGAQEVNLDLAASEVTFVGSKPVGTHSGAFKISEGKVNVDGDKVVGGTFTIDIASLEITDPEDALDEESRGKLAGHLASEEFFKSEEFPTATFVITEVAEGYERPEGEEVDAEYALENPTHTVTGNLTLLGVEKSITFPANVEVTDGKVSAVAKFNIDRTNWNIVYGNDEGLGDSFIYPTVHIGFDVKSE